MATRQDITDTSIFSELGGEPVMLTAQPDGSVLLTRKGELERLTIEELNSRYSNIPTVDLGEDVEDELRAEHVAELGLSEDSGEEESSAGEDELYEAWRRFRESKPGSSAQVPETEKGVDFSAEDGLYDDWRSYREAQGADLAEDSSGESSAGGASEGLKVGQAVEWGSGAGTGHGVLQELDTAEGMALVHTAEVIDEIGEGEALSPTGRTIRVDGSKLRPSKLPLIGERPVGPELSSEDESVWSKVSGALRRMKGGTGEE